VQVRLEVVGPESHSDEEHVQTAAELRADVQHALVLRREHEGLRLGREQAEQRGT
jgi:hypothetical protein